MVDSEILRIAKPDGWDPEFMKSVFCNVIKARSRDGISLILASAALFLVSAGIAIYMSLDPVAVGPAAYSVPLALALTAGVFLLRTGSDYRAVKEWGFCADADRIWWVRRDVSGERLDGEAHIQDIRALIYHAGDDGDPFLEFEFKDGSVARFPSRGHLTPPRLREFINYWHEAHGDIPIKNLW